MSTNPDGVVVTFPGAPAAPPTETDRVISLRRQVVDMTADDLEWAEGMISLRKPANNVRFYR
jgi:hypothetical protein